jgi:hypothetical protein
MTKWRRGLVSVAVLFATTGPGLAADQYYYGRQTLRYGNTSGGQFDARNDDRDFPNNGFFPGNFAANPLFASIGAAGFLESNPLRSRWPYPSQVYFPPMGEPVSCAHHRCARPLQ